MIRTGAAARRRLWSGPAFPLALALVPVALALAPAVPAGASPIHTLKAHLSDTTPATPATTPVTLALHLSLPGGRHLRSYQLVFGDGVVQSGTRLPLTVHHRYAALTPTGTTFYPATLRAVDSGGHVASASTRVSVVSSVSVASAQAQSVVWWSSAGPGILASLRDGECTDWGSRKREDIVERVMEANHAKALEGLSAPNVTWVAKSWTSNAHNAGLHTGSTPAAGAIVVFQPGVDGAGSMGHVGYVEAVNPSGSFRISEENVGQLYQLTSRTLPGGKHTGISFIYR